MDKSSRFWLNGSKYEFCKLIELGKLQKREVKYQPAWNLKKYKNLSNHIVFATVF